MSSREPSIAERLLELTGGRLEPRSVLGEGTYGTVVRAWDRAREEWVAAKILRREEPTSLARFKREFRALADIRHDNLVTLHELFSDGRTFAFSMELLEGEPLSAYVERPRPTAGFARFVLRGVVDGTSALHDHGLLHRDVKASNVVLTRSGRVVVLDFGLLDRIGEPAGSASEGFAGTPAYLAPECLDSGRSSIASDAYAVGTLIFELLAGRLPFEGSALEVLVAKASAEAPSLATLRPDLDEELRATIDALLARDPEVRERAWRRLRGNEPASTIALPFVGRDEELAAIVGASATSRAHPVLVEVEADAGVGKTAFLDALEGRLRADDGAVVVRGRAFERESVPHGLLDGVVDGLVHALGRSRLAPELAPEDASALVRTFPVMRAVVRDTASTFGGTLDEGAVARERAALALRRIVSAIASRGPVALLLDDAHFADADSATLLERLLAPPHAPRVLVVVAKRPTRTRPDGFLEALGGPGLPALGVLDTRRIRLGALSAAEALSLVHAARPTLDETRGGELVEAAGGHALALVTMMLRSQTSAVEGGSGRFASGFDSLEPRARALVSAVAVRSSPVSLRLLLRVVSGVAPSSRDVDALVDARWLRRCVGDDPRQLHVEPAHDLVRVAVRERLGPSAIAELEGAWAKTLAPDDDPVLVADVWAALGRTADAARLLEDAAREAERRLAFRRSVDLREHARRVDPEADADGSIGERIGLAFAASGRSSSAAHAFEQAARAARADEATRIQRLRRAAEHALRAGDLVHGRRLLDEVLARHRLPRPDSPAACLAWVLLERARLSLRGLELATSEPDDGARAAERIDAAAAVGIGLSVVDSVRAAAYQSMALRLALDAGDVVRAQRAFAFAACFNANAGLRDAERTDRLLERARSLARTTGLLEAEAHAVTASSLVAFHRGRFADAHADASRGASLFRSLDERWWKELVTAELYAGLSAIALGRVGVARALVGRLLPEVDARGDRYGSTNLRSGLFARLHLFADDLDAAVADVDAARRAWSVPGYHVQHVFDLLARVDHALHRGRPQEAFAAFAEDEPRYRRSLLGRSQWIRIHRALLAGRASLLAAPDEPGRLSDVERAARAIERERAPWALGHVDALRGGMRVLTGDAESAVELLRRAARRYVEVDLAIEAAVAARASAELVGDAEAAASADGSLVALGIVDPTIAARLYLPLPRSLPSVGERGLVRARAPRGARGYDAHAIRGAWR